MQMRFDRMEWAGSMGDLGTLLPLAFAMIVINGMSTIGVFLSVGLFYLCAGLYFRVPIAVQPMKVVSAYAIAQALSPGVVTASGMLLATSLLILGTTGLVNTVSKLVPKATVRGVQMATGVLLLTKGASLIVGSNSFQTLAAGSEPYLAFQSLGPVAMSLIIGAVFGCVALLLMNNRRYPAGLVVVVAGAVVGSLLGAWKELSGLSLGINLPQFLPFGFPTGVDFSFALLALVLPQVPMTLGNAVIANRDLSFEYFGDESRRVTDRALCISMGLANAVAACIGGMPICHGAGGLAAHYRFGARTNGSNVIIGGLFIILAVLFGAGAVNVLHLLPMGVLGVLLFFAGTQLALTVMDVSRRTDMFVVVTMLGITLVSNLAWAFGVGICLAYFFKLTRATI